jgi:hypothetical protein
MFNQNDPRHMSKLPTPRLLGVPNDPALRGGIPLQRVPVIPWEAFVACGLKVHRDGKIQLCLFEPQPMDTAEEAFQTIRFLLASQQGKPGPVSWETVPDEVKRHFRFQDSAETG